MLVALTVRNVVLIEKLMLELEPGFNVLTGETGAGKSMLVDALGLVLGGRASPELVRTNEKEAEVEALFEIEPGSRVVERLEAAGVPFEPGEVIEIVVRRTVQVSGRSRAFVNGRLCTAAQLGELAPDLCDIASQHESVSLTDPATHLEYLDAFGKLDAEREGLAVEVEAIAAVTRELDEARDAEKSRAEREDVLTFQLRDLDDLDLQPGEEHTLANERGRLRHAEKLGASTRRGAERLYDAEGAICDELARIASEIESAGEIDGSLAPLARTIDGARAELADAARELARYADAVEGNPERLREVEERLFRLEKWLLKHGPTTDDLITYRDEIRKQLDAMLGAGDRVESLSKKREALVDKAAEAAKKLSKKRRAAAERLADAIGKELARLGMGRARVIVDVAPVAAPVAQQPGIAAGGARLTKSGIDRVEFLIAPNPGEDPRPLRRIASGGELSRALLAIKRVLAEKGPAGLYVFDEVDAGVGGGVAEVIGRAIADVAKHRQVLCITHLAQIAAQAGTHFVVDKSEAKGRTTTSVRKLSSKERTDEIARMIGGVRVTDTARKAAAEMLRS
ncbi:MAG TPA: DNA repair protein RecN [Polyangiaceae bacterium]